MFGSTHAAKQWQSVEAPDKFWEIMGISFSAVVPPTEPELAEQTKPNLEWVFEHFKERVGGVPLNPGESYKLWPPYKNKATNDKFRTEEEKFSHTYMERIWCHFAGEEPGKKVIKLNPYKENPNKGIRYLYGDLGDLLNLLTRDIDTRQAFLPIWFPEDTGAVHGQRVPCTLGYLFLHRHGYLHMTYYMRSCDFLRHFRDDVYLAGALLQWVCAEVNHLTGRNILPGTLTMHIANLHVFNNEKELLKPKKQ
jgi:hypothetical protein